MMDNICFFPSNEKEALAMLYLQAQDIKDLSPEELAERYVSVLNRIKDTLKPKKTHRITAKDLGI